jgi:hypothetical protein
MVKKGLDRHKTSLANEHPSEGGLDTSSYEWWHILKGSLAIKRLPISLVQATMERRVAPLLMPPAERLPSKTSS